MKVSTMFLRSAFVLVVLVTAAALFAGCGNKEEAKQEAQLKLVTMDNLQSAYAAESKAAAWYEKFAEQAQKENLGDIAVLFRVLSKSEQVHVANVAKLLKARGVEPAVPAIDPIAPGKTRQYLKLCVSNENVEQSMLASYVAVAEQEKVPEAVEVFRRNQDADARHGRLLKRAIEQESNFARLPYLMCPECGYIVGSDKLDACPVCKAPKEKFEKL